MSSTQLWGSIPFPPGDNDTDTHIGRGHLNLDTLEEFGYTLFSNNTLSNGTKCALAFAPYEPVYIFPNGTFTNVTWCWRALDPVGARGGTSVGFAVLFALALVCVLVCLRKHGRLFLPVTKRFFPISRRWQWYWAIMVCTFAIISLFMNIDVDRYYVMEIPIVLTCFFWFLMQMAAMALVWEAVRHWASWMERQIVDGDQFALKEDDRRSKVEFYLPLCFYLFWWLNFFMIIPRKWGNIELQRSPEQLEIRARPSATDARFKAAGFLHLACWLITLTSLLHSVKHYVLRRYGHLSASSGGALAGVPLRFYALLPLGLAVVAYQILAAFEFDYSPLKVEGNLVAIFVGGYVPSLLIVVVQCANGYATPNEDVALLRLRQERGEEINRELGIVHKPSWWRRLHGDNAPVSMRDVIANNVREVGGREQKNGRKGSGTEAFVNDGSGVELGESPVRGDTAAVSPPAATAPGFDARRPPFSPYTGKSEQRRAERAMQHAAGLLFPNESPSSGSSREAELMMDGPPPSYEQSTQLRPPAPVLSPGARDGQSNGNAPQIRSMLDI